MGVFVISGFTSAATGAMLLGWSGGGFVGAGDIYLFTTLAAVVIGGTSLLRPVVSVGSTAVDQMAAGEIGTGETHPIRADIGRIGIDHHSSPQISAAKIGA